MLKIWEISFWNRLKTNLSCLFHFPNRFKSISLIWTFFPNFIQPKSKTFKKIKISFEIFFSLFVSPTKHLLWSSKKFVTSLQKPLVSHANIIQIIPSKRSKLCLTKIKIQTTYHQFLSPFLPSFVMLQDSNRDLEEDKKRTWLLNFHLKIPHPANRIPQKSNKFTCENEKVTVKFMMQFSLESWVIEVIFCAVHVRH